MYNLSTSEWTIYNRFFFSQLVKIKYCTDISIQTDLYLCRCSPANPVRLKVQYGSSYRIWRVCSRTFTVIPNTALCRLWSFSPAQGPEVSGLSGYFALFSFPVALTSPPVLETEKHPTAMLPPPWVIVGVVLGSNAYYCQLLQITSCILLGFFFLII